MAYVAPKRLEGQRARLGTDWERKHERNVPETFLRRIPSRFTISRRIHTRFCNIMGPLKTLNCSGGEEDEVGGFEKMKMTEKSTFDFFIRFC